MSLPVVLLAAGLSRRMGEKNKLLMPFNGRTLVETAIVSALSYTDTLWIVTGYQREKIIQVVSAYRNVGEIFNPDYEKGQETSIRAALARLEGPLIILPSDLPGIRKEDYEECEKALQNHQAARAMFNERPGHPVALSSEAVDLYRAGNIRLRDLMQRLDTACYEAAPSSTLDLDTEEDFRKIQQP